MILITHSTTQVLLILILYCILFHFQVAFAKDDLEDGVNPEIGSNFYVFGDSNFEFGEKSRGHDSWMKTGYDPYGTSCTYLGADRFTNGYTVPELIAQSIGKKVASIDLFRVYSEYGSTFASASAGILPQTGTAFGKNLCFKEQIRVFKELLQKGLKDKYQLPQYLADSIYLINIGASDYIHNYLQPNYYNTSKCYNDEQFAELLTSEYSKYIKDLYKLGARNMVLFQIGPLGCYPYMIEKFKPRSRCVENINKLVSKFNDKLDVKLKELRNELEGSKLVTARVFSLIEDMIKTPAHYGFEETRWPCCPIDRKGTGLCRQVVKIVPDSERVSLEPELKHWLSACEDQCKDIPMSESLKRSRKWTGENNDIPCFYTGLYVFFDGLHLTQTANNIIAERCVASKGGMCSDVGINQLTNN